jgi:hypothetical protein
MAAQSMLSLGILTGCGSGASGQGMPVVTDHFGDVIVMNVENEPYFQTLLVAAYTPESCLSDTPTATCYVSPSCPKPAMEASAGTITVTGKTPVTLTPKDDKSYQTQVLTERLADPGQTVQISAAGADVPAHSATVTMPEAMQLTMPNGSAPLLIDRSQDLPLTWSPSNASSVYLFLGAYATDNTLLQSIVCTFDDRAGTGSIPSALLQGLPPTSDGSTAFLTLTRYNWTMTTAGDWGISVGGASYLSDSATLQ